MRASNCDSAAGRVRMPSKRPSASSISIRYTSAFQASIANKGSDRILMRWPAVISLASAPSRKAPSGSAEYNQSGQRASRSNGRSLTRLLLSQVRSNSARLARKSCCAGLSARLRES